MSRPPKKTKNGLRKRQIGICSLALSEVDCWRNCSETVTLQRKVKLWYEQIPLSVRCSSEAELIRRDVSMCELD